MSIVEKTEFVEARLLVEKPGQVIVGVIEKVGAWDDEAQRWVGAPEPRGRSLNSAEPADLEEIEKVCGAAVIEALKAAGDANKLRDEAVAHATAVEAAATKAVSTSKNLLDEANLAIQRQGAVIEAQQNEIRLLKDKTIERINTGELSPEEKAAAADLAKVGEKDKAD